MSNQKFQKLLVEMKKLGAKVADSCREVAANSDAVISMVRDEPEKGLVITTKEGGKKTLEADTILVTLPYLPNNDIVKSFEGKAPEIYVIGSGGEPGLIVNAIADGAKIGHKI